MATARKKSPRAPTISLNDALERAMKAYDKERLHSAPVDVMAQHIGYKTANNGAALQALASLRYYGLLERPQDGQLAVSKDVEALRFAPDENLSRSLLVRFLRTPVLFSELLDKYEQGLPSDGNLKYELIQRGFMPATAEVVMTAFKRSVEFARYFETSLPSEPAFIPNPVGSKPPPEEFLHDPTSERTLARPREVPVVEKPPELELSEDAEHDKIPVRLPGGRRAWLVIPAPFYQADKQRLKAQIDLLLTEDEDRL